MCDAHETRRALACVDFKELKIRRNLQAVYVTMVQLIQADTYASYIQ